MCRFNKTQMLLLALILLISTMSINADVPQLMNYQGRLTDNFGILVPDSSYEITFKIWDSDVDGATKWSETHSSIIITDGLFNVLLGSITPLPDSVFKQPSRWFGISIGGEDLLPRTRIATVPYAYNAQTLSFVPTDSADECTEANRGKVYFDDSKNKPCYCDGVAWMLIDGSGLCVIPAEWDNDSDGYDIFDIGDPMDTDGNPADCDDNDPDVNWGAFEVCDDLKDNDCDELIDMDDEDCSGYAPEEGVIVITEFMANPDNLGDTVGEWFEIYNTHYRRINLYGVTIANATGSHLITETVIVEPYSYFTFAISAEPGFTPDYIYSTVSLNNSGDQIRLLLDDLLIDDITYGATVAGISSELSNNNIDYIDNDNMSNWCPATSSFSTGDLGTPTEINDCSF